MVKMKKTAELKDGNINIADQAETIIGKKNTKSMKKSTKKKSSKKNKVDISQLTEEERKLLAVSHIQQLITEGLKKGNLTYTEIMNARFRLLPLAG